MNWKEILEALKDLLKGGFKFLLYTLSFLAGRKSAFNQVEKEQAIEELKRTIELQEKRKEIGKKYEKLKKHFDNPGSSS